MNDGNRINIHVTQVGGCIRRAVLELKGVEKTDTYYHAQLGTMVHKVAEAILLDPDRDIKKALAAGEESDPDFYSEYEQEILEKVDRLVAWLTDYADPSVFSPEALYEHEMEKEMPGLTIDGLPVYITGTADILTPLEAIDLKSGKSRSKKHAWQVAVYAMLKALADKEPVRSGRIVYLSEEFEERTLKNGKVKRKHERVIELEKMVSYYLEWEKEAIGYIEAIDEAFRNEPEPDNCTQSFFCPYKTLCFGEGGGPSGY